MPARHPDDRRLAHAIAHLVRIAPSQAKVHPRGEKKKCDYFTTTLSHSDPKRGIFSFHPDGEFLAQSPSAEGGGGGWGSSISARTCQTEAQPVINPALERVRKLRILPQRIAEVEAPRAKIAYRSGGQQRLFKGRDRTGSLVDDTVDFGFGTRQPEFGIHSFITVGPRTNSAAPLARGRAIACARRPRKCCLARLDHLIRPSLRDSLDHRRPFDDVPSAERWPKAGSDCVEEFFHRARVRDRNTCTAAAIAVTHINMSQRRSILSLANPGHAASRLGKAPLFLGKISPVSCHTIH